MCIYYLEVGGPGWVENSVRESVYVYVFSGEYPGCLGILMFSWLLLTLLRLLRM